MCGVSSGGAARSRYVRCGLDLRKTPFYDLASHRIAAKRVIFRSVMWRKVMMRTALFIAVFITVVACISVNLHLLGQQAEKEQWALVKRYYHEQGGLLQRELEGFAASIKPLPKSYFLGQKGVFFFCKAAPLLVLSLDHIGRWPVPLMLKPTLVLDSLTAPPGEVLDLFSYEWHTQYSLLLMWQNTLNALDVELRLRKKGISYISADVILPKKDSARAWCKKLFAACLKETPWYLRVQYARVAALLAHTAGVYNEFLTELHKLPPYCHWGYVLEGIKHGEIGAFDYIFALRRVMAERLAKELGESTPEGIRKHERMLYPRNKIFETPDSLPFCLQLVEVAPQEAIQQAQKASTTSRTTFYAALLNWFYDNYTHLEWTGGRWEKAKRALRKADSPVRKELVKALQEYQGTLAPAALPVAFWQQVLAFLRTGKQQYLPKKGESR